MRRLWIAPALALALALPLQAGVEYKARTWQEGKQANKQADMSVWSRVDGDKARIEFQESGNPWMSQGSYLLTTDAGRTMVLVKPEDETYGEFDLESMMQMLGALSASGMIDFRVENAKLETLPAGPGKTVAGMDARHARYRITYDLEMKIIGIRKRQMVETVQDIWYTDAIPDPAMVVWLRKDPPRTNTDLDKLVELEGRKISGFALETAETMTSTGKKGKQTTTTTRMRVLEIERGVSFPAGTFEIPEGYTPVQMMPSAEMMAGGQPPPEGEEGEEKGGLKSRLKRFGRKK